MLSKEEQQKRLDEKRREVLDIFNKDPLMGFETFDDAFKEAKITSQPEVLARLLNKENLFISGLAGAGKTAVINRFIEFIDAQYDGVFNIAITASTGIAATLIGGTTIHSWSGLGISTDDFDRNKLEDSMKRKMKPIRDTDVLIIDEISMLPAYFFTKLDAFMKFARKSNEPFGGVQLVLIGDFLQLPPVSKQGDTHDTRFAIETSAWKNANLNYCFLDKTYRTTDQRLKGILLEIAANKLSAQNKKLLESRVNIAPDPNKVYTNLFTMNKNVDKFNQEKLDENPNKMFTFHIQKELGYKEADLDKLIKKYKIPERIVLKDGAIVICTKNIQDEHGNTVVSNGSIGQIIKINFLYVTVRFNNGVIKSISPAEYSEKIKEKEHYWDTKTNSLQERVITKEIARVEQLPLKLGYAITVHKSQGQTFDGVIVDLRNIFQEGLGYVALSRVRSLDDLIINGSINKKAYNVSERSQKISTYTKKKAYQARKEFMKPENLEDYQSVIENDIFRNIIWDVNDTASSNNVVDNKREKN